jgi:hypothetical protein
MPTPQSIRGQINLLAQELPVEGIKGLQPGRRSFFKEDLCVLLDDINSSQGAALDARDQKLARDWQVAADEWSKLYAAITTQTDQITAAAGGIEPPSCCLRHAAIGRPQGQRV